ncbi:MAG TPA: hypothetical protein VK570_14305 [Rubrivivax sp.]|nr:hypothetical protein [Rubrivivax sp.]
MNQTTVFSALLGIACWVSAGSTHAAVIVPTAAASAASAARTQPPTRQQLPTQSTAVRASQGAASPGDLRPGNPVVPQIAVPLRRDRDATASEGAGSAGLAGAIHDTAARCKAATSDRERAACIRSGNVQGTLPKR